MLCWNSATLRRHMDPIAWHSYSLESRPGSRVQMLQDGDYSYVLLDLQIPAKPNRGGADKEFGSTCSGIFSRSKAEGEHR